MTLDLSNIHGKTKELFSAPSTLIFGATISPASNMEYEVSYTPTSTTSSLISKSSTGVALDFQTTSTRSDAQQYMITIKARQSGGTAWLATATATFTFINPCLSATITGTNHPNIIASVLATASSTTSLWFDSVSGTPQATQNCGGFTLTRSYILKPET